MGILHCDRSEKTRFGRSVSTRHFFVTTTLRSHQQLQYRTIEVRSYWIDTNVIVERMSMNPTKKCDIDGHQRRILALIPVQTSHSLPDGNVEHITMHFRDSSSYGGPRQREHKPWIHLFPSTTGSLPYAGEESVVIGRKELLRAYHATCPERQQKEKRSLCERCQQIKEWGMTSLSRSMIKITQNSARSNTNEQGNLFRNAHQYQVQVHGPNAFLVRVNDIPVLDSNYGETADDISWKGACWILKPLENRTIISVGSDMNFEFKDIENDPDYDSLTFIKGNDILSVLKPGTEAENKRLQSQLRDTSAICADVPFLEGPVLPYDTCLSHGLQAEKSHVQQQELSSETEALPNNIMHSQIADYLTIESTTVETMDTKQEKAFTGTYIKSHIPENTPLDTPATVANYSPQKVSYVDQEASSVKVSDNVSLNARNQINENQKSAEINHTVSEQRVSPGSLEDHELKSITSCVYPEAIVSGEVETSASINKSCASVENVGGEKTNSYVIYILPLGRKLPRQRIEILTRKMMRIPNVTIVSSVSSNCGNPLKISQHEENKITHIVIDETVPINDVVTFLKYKSEEELVNTLTEENITAVTPDWIIQCPDCSRTLLQQPLLNQIWHNLNVSIKKPKDTGWFQRKKYMQDCDRFGSIKYVKASEVAENNSVISMISKKRKNSLVDQDSVRRMLLFIHFYWEPSSGETWKNVKLAGMFDQLSKLHTEMPLEGGDQWRAYTFAVIASRLRHLEFEVDPSMLKQLEDIKGFGKSVMKKVREFFSTGGSCERIRQFTCDETRIAIRNMMNIWGVGRVKAKMLVDDGFTNIMQIRQALKEKKLVLSRNALIGVDYYEDFNEKMCRSEVSAIRDICFECCIEKFPNCELTATGSFRRGESHCSDVDIIILDREYETSTPKGALWWLVDKLMREGHIAHHLTHWDHDTKEMEVANNLTFRNDANDSNSNPSGRIFSEGAEKFIGKNSGVQSYMGVFNSPRFSGKKRRIDIKFYPYDERAFAFLYFTGNTLFNRSMRQYATKVKAMKLSNRDLRPILREPLSLGQPLKASTEKDVFDILGLVYRDPSQRDGFDAVIPIERSKKFEFLNHSLEIVSSEKE